MKIRCFQLILKDLFQKNDMHNVLHLTVFNRFRKNIKDVYLKILKDFR